jgi:hypothetical protein
MSSIPLGILARLKELEVLKMVNERLETLAEIMQ